ncbi:hypothetical protein HG536_0F02170 [Torulaspora globosa]|uniref:UBX domain-containing protein n=1 Tax=Torulaspora globosa TaxID=48254 RepID=A0A7G3ZK56_9SACH|nr:uncharacterized protein HG536_0F02170 [Torulaspora globosa]QLL33892.1 hypothetical protein HG536_0F02170 [Torulaspora globosa]
MAQELFLSSVEEGVAKSMREGKILVLYTSAGDDVWLNSWFKSDFQSRLSRHAVWLKLVRGTDQFRYFEQIFPSVVVPSLCFIRNGQILSTIEGEEDKSGGEGHWGKLMATLGAGSELFSARKAPGEAKQRNLKEQVADTAQRKYHEEMQKQRKQSKEERERILRLVEADKAERRVRRKSSEDNSQGGQRQLQDNIKNIERLHADECTLLIRLTNGENIMKKFDSKLKLNDVRSWVDANRTDSDCPYAFHRNIPRVTFSDSDELKTLEALDLSPRSALILKPLENARSRLNIAEAKGPGLLGKVFNGLSSWWAASGREQNERHQSSDCEEDKDVADNQGKPTQRFPDAILENNQALDSIASSSTIREEAVTASPHSSRIDSPLYSASDFHIKHNPSELSLPSRCVTPNVHQFVNVEDEDNDRFAYNGNNIKLEKKKDDDKCMDG